MALPSTPCVRCCCCCCCCCCCVGAICSHLLRGGHGQGGASRRGLDEAEGKRALGPLEGLGLGRRGPGAALVLLVVVALFLGLLGYNRDGAQARPNLGQLVSVKVVDPP